MGPNKENGPAYLFAKLGNYLLALLVCSAPLLCPPCVSFSCQLTQQKKDSFILFENRIFLLKFGTKFRLNVKSQKSQRRARQNPQKSSQTILHSNQLCKVVVVAVLLVLAMLVAVGVLVSSTLVSLVRTCKLLVVCVPFYSCPTLNKNCLFSVIFSRGPEEAPILTERHSYVADLKRKEPSSISDQFKVTLVVVEVVAAVVVVVAQRSLFANISLKIMRHSYRRIARPINFSFSTRKPVD